MKQLSNFTDEQLQAELARREEAKKQREIPKPRSNVNFSKLQKLIEDEVACRANGVGSEDFKQWIFEEAMNSVYGPSIWEWWNKHHR